MFADHTVQTVAAVVGVDKGVTDAERDALMRVLLGFREPTVGRCVRYAEAAKLLGVSVPTIKRLVKAGRLKAVRGAGECAMGVTFESVRGYAS